MDNVHRKDPAVIIAFGALHRQDTVQTAPSVDSKISFDSLPTLSLGFEPERPTLPNPPDFPDGGLRAWSVVIGVSIMIIAHFRSN